MERLTWTVALLYLCSSESYKEVLYVVFLLAAGNDSLKCITRRRLVGNNLYIDDSMQVTGLNDILDIISQVREDENIIAFSKNEDVILYWSM